MRAHVRPRTRRFRAPHAPAGLWGGCRPQVRGEALPERDGLRAGLRAVS